MNYELTVEELEDIIDEILDEDLLGSIDEKTIEAILFEDLDDTINESMSDAVKEFLEVFDQKTSQALEDKIIERIAKNNDVDVSELTKVVGV